MSGTLSALDTSYGNLGDLARSGSSSNISASLFYNDSSSVIGASLI